MPNRNQNKTENAKFENNYYKHIIHTLIFYISLSFRWKSFDFLNMQKLRTFRLRGKCTFPQFSHQTAVYYYCFVSNVLVQCRHLNVLRFLDFKFIFFNLFIIFNNLILFENIQ